MVIELTNGAMAAAGAFALNGRVAAGAHEYFLFKGGISAGTAENFYLRSTLVTPPVVTPPVIVPPVVIIPPPVTTPLPEVVTPDVIIVPPGPGATPPSEGATPVAPEVVVVPIAGTPTAVEVVPLYRVEVPTYSAVPPVAQYLALSSLGTFHERRGDQALLNGAGALPASWMRVFGQNAEFEWEGTVSPGFDGNLFGFQAGQDLFAWEGEGGHHDRVGLLVGYARTSGDIKGQALGWNNLSVGEIDVDATSIGGYWTHIGPNDWYLDAVLMGSWFDGDARSNGGTGIEIDGTGITASLEGGYPISLAEGWTLEPQAQLIWQHLSSDDQRDAFSAVNFDSDDAVTGRLGFRLQGDIPTETATLQPLHQSQYLARLRCGPARQLRHGSYSHQSRRHRRGNRRRSRCKTVGNDQPLRNGGLHDQSRWRQKANSGGEYRPQHKMVTSSADLRSAQPNVTG